MKHGTRALALLLCLGLIVGLLPALTIEAAAVNQVLLMEQAQSLAVSNSRAITKKSNEILLKQIKYVEAVDGIKAKIKNLRSFRWSPLLSFKFPQPLDMTNEYEMNIKPLTLQAEIDTLKHALDDLRFEARRNVSKAYNKVYILQEKVAFTQARLDTAQGELQRNKARLATGGALQTDVDKMQKTVDTLTAELSELKRNFLIAKQDLSELIGLDVSSGYIFRNALKELALPRQQLNSVITYTLDHDQSFYEAKMSASTALMNLTSYESLMRNQYGSKMNYIQTYLDLAKNGGDVDYSSFMLKYREMLTALDQPWKGNIWILFFRFSKEWFKGAIDGTRYIEDEMYAIYTACMDYAAAKTERDSQEKNLRKNIAAQYELLVSAWNSYESLAGQVTSDKEHLDKVTALNKLGKAEYDELKDARDSYEEIQLSAVDALVEYNDLLMDFDRLTCGAVTAYLQGADIGAEAGGTGDSFAQVDPISDPYYYIYTTVDDLTFHIGVSLPELFLPVITDFEVWHGDVQIGTQVPVTEEVRHLTLDYGGDSLLTLRFYDTGSFVAQCDIDASVSRDRLDLGDGGTPIQEDTTLGTYEVSTTAVGGLTTSTLTLNVHKSLGAASYTIAYGTNNVYTSDPISLSDPFTYLTLLVASLGDVELKLFSRDGTLVATGRFDPESSLINGTTQ